MIRTDYNGNFGVDQIKKIIKRSYGTNYMYVISLENDLRKLYVCDLNSFVLESGKSKAVKELESGDKIWIDISAFGKDGTLK